MTTSIDGGDFSKVSNVDPGGGLSYRVYVGANQDSYDVSISEPGFFVSIDNYYVFSLASPAWDNADSISAGMPGTFATGAGDDLLLNNLPTENTYGFPQPIRFFGGAGNDTINDPSQVQDAGDQIATEGYGGSGDDIVYGGNTDDTLYGDTADGFTGNPTIGSVDLAAYDTSNDGDDSLYGGDGADTLSGDGGDDLLYGGNGADSLSGGDGSDFLYGGPRGAGNLDLLTGGNDADVFVLSYAQGGSGAGFWAPYFEKMGQDIANNLAKTAIQDAIKGALDGVAGGFLAPALGPVGGDLAALFVSFLEGLEGGGKPKNAQDVMVVTDFDPRQDVLMLPLQSQPATALTVTVTSANQMPGGSGSDTTSVLQFSYGSTVYAYVRPSDGFIADLGVGASGDAIEQVLNNLFAFSSSPQQTGGTIGLSNLAQGIAANLPDGGFQPQAGTLPSGVQATLFGAVGGMVMSSPGGAYGSVLAGTNYADALTTNPALFDPEGAGTYSFAKTGANISAFDGDDLVYGTEQADDLYGGNGNDTLYSFVSAANSGGGVDAELLSGGDGDDLLVGGGTAGTLDGGNGTDTFAVLYYGNEPAMQLAVDLTQGWAAERKLADDPDSGTAPVGDTPPFVGTGPDEEPNNYTLTGIENVIGGPLNDWIKGAPGSVVEGGAGADYLDATAGQVTVSYAGSADPVTVQLYAEASQAAGGDAAGDVIGYADTGDIATLAGSAGDDTLGGYSDGDIFAFTGNGGADLFQLLGTAAHGGIFEITDFATGDLIDLRPLGTTSYDQVSIGEGFIEVMAATGGLVIASIVLQGFSGTLTDADILLASAASGEAQAGRGGDALVGAEAGDRLIGSTGQDFLFGGASDDVLAGRGGNDVLDGGADDDRLIGNAGNDRLQGGRGDDTGFGGNGEDRLFGGAGADLLRGGNGGDVLAGGAGDDGLFGGRGDDTLAGGDGADAMRGGQGADLFELRFGELDGDRILGFRPGEGDRLQLLADRAVTVEDRGQGVFAVSDGILTEILRVRGAAAEDFLLG